MFETLVCRERPLTLVRRKADPPEEPVLDLDLEGDEGEGNGTSGGPPAHRLAPGEAFTDRDDQHLNTVLYRLRLRARTAVAEQGVNILFVAFGVLQWADPANNEVRSSPLILVPVELRRETALSPYRLWPIEEEVILNPTLAFLLERDCHLALPSLPGDLDSARFEDYCQCVETIIAGQKEWSVRREVHLGTFSFSKLVMYRDLDTNTARIGAHPLIQALAGDPYQLDQAQELPTAIQLDDVLSPEQTFHVLDADSTQHEAIEAAKRGVSLVLQGPPGTGKSQTITNIIAEMLAAGKRVLFVSEKMAALQVVHNRLKARKLDDFCLEVHSAKASKTEVLKDIGRALRLNEQPIPPGASRALSQLKDLSSHLNRYAHALHTPRGPMNWSAFYVHGQLAAVHPAPELNFGFARPVAVDSEQLAHIDSLLMRMEGVRPIILTCETHPWRGTLIPKFTFEVQAEIHERFNLLRDQLRNLDVDAQTLAAACHLPGPSSLDGVDWLLQVADMVRCTPRPPRHWFDAEDLKQLVEDAEAFQSRFHTYLERRGRLLARYRSSVLSLNASELREILVELNEESLQVFRGNDQPRDVLWQQEPTLHPLLEDTVQLLARLTPALQAVSARCAVPVQATLRGAHRLLALSALAINDPRPTSKWFKRAQLRLIRDRTRRASEVYPAHREQQSRLLATYDPGVLELDLVEMIQRFSTDYANVTRLLRPNYWRDKRALRSVQRMPGKLTVEAGLADLRLAREVSEYEQWIRENEPHLEEELGVWFKGVETSWPDVTTALDHLGGILDWFGQAEPSPALVQILMTSGAEVAELHRLHDVATTLVSRTEVVLGQLLRSTDAQLLPFGVTAAAEVEFTVLQEWATSTRAACLEFWAAKKVVVQEALLPERISWKAAVADLEETLWMQSEGQALAEASKSLREKYDHFFEGEATDWRRIIEALVWTGAFRELFRGETLPDELLHLVSRGGGDVAELVNAIPACHKLRVQTEKGVEHLTSLFSLMITECNGGIRRWKLDTLCSWLEERVKRSAELEHWLDFRRIQVECEAAGLDSFFTKLMLECPEGSSLRNLFYRRYYRLWLDSVYGEDKSLGEFRARDHERMIEQFRELDRSQWDRLGPVRIRQTLLERRQPIIWPYPPKSEPWILTRELEKRRRHKPLRQLFAEIPSLLQELKPCLLMSPMTVSQLLDPQRYQFDLVIFDEASQICAEDAVGSIYRGKQIVVAGDRHQLPPTRFFTAGFSDAYDGEEEEAAEEDVYESILDQCRTILPIKPLKWHYRSRHESLIAFSNVHIYSKEVHESLKTFPSAQARGPRIGIELVRVVGAVYDRKKTRRNLIEASKVAELVIEHMRQSPQQSLGVVAFSEAQQMAILAEVERLGRVYPELDDAFHEDRPEPFFVKNLENVQGDERDVIFLNIGYGKDAAGALSLNFGPLNRQGGERRLNVAVTRAKYHLKLVTSLTAGDIDLARTHSRGIPLLRAYLEYAERGPDALARADERGDGIQNRLFEESVRLALEQRKYKVDSQVGYCGYRVDLAIRHPEDPDRYILGIECDGGEYSSASTARDRDRLSQAVLAGTNDEPGLGWKLHRLWSTEWVKDPERELNRIKEAVMGSLKALALSAQGAASPPSVSTKPTGVQDSDSALDSEGPRSQDQSMPEYVLDQARSLPNGVVPYERAALTTRGSSERFYLANRSVILRALNQVVAAEGPILLMEATRRVAAAWGIRNAGSQVQTIVAAAADYGVRSKQLAMRGGFLWSSDMQTPPVRTHENSEWTRKIDEICPEEIDEAVQLVMRNAFSLPEPELLTQTARMLGFGRTGAEVRDRIAAAVVRLIAAGKLAEREGAICLVRQ